MTALLGQGNNQRRKMLIPKLVANNQYIEEDCIGVRGKGTHNENG